MMKLIIPEPCNQNWSEMQPASEGRFCSSCTKNVIDFTGFTDAQLVSYFNSSPKNVCGKLSFGQINRNLRIANGAAFSKTFSASKLYSLRNSPLFVGLGFSLLNITSCIPATGKVTFGELEVTETRNAKPPSSSEKLSITENSELKDPDSKDRKPENKNAEDHKLEDHKLEDHKLEDHKLKDHKLEDRKLEDRKSEEPTPQEPTPEKAWRANDEIKAKQVQINRASNKLPDTIPGNHTLISTVNRRQYNELLPAKISSYLTNTFHIVDTVITGIVKDTAGLAIAGATVVIDGSPIGVVTDTEGRFSLTVPPEQTKDRIKLSIQYIGYNAKLLSVHAPFFKDLNIALVPVSNVLLGDVVFVGGIYIKPTIWQRIKNLVTFWK